MVNVLYDNANVCGHTTNVLPAIANGIKHMQIAERSMTNGRDHIGTLAPVIAASIKTIHLAAVSTPVLTLS